MKNDLINIAIVGAGQTGRGFLARLFYKNANIVFIDSNRDLVNNLRHSKGYTVRYFNSGEPEFITGYEIYHIEDDIPMLQFCDVVFVSVLAENTAAAGLWLEDKINSDAIVIACENAACPAELFTGPIKEVAGSGAVFCTAINDGPTDILSEEYPFLHVGGYHGDVIKLPGIQHETDFDILMQRKIYTYNAASAVIAYLGAAKGYESFSDAANDPQINDKLDEFYDEINKAICTEYKIDFEEQRLFALQSKHKFQNKHISDSIARNAASPERKLGPTERIIKPANLIISRNGNPAISAEVAAAALHYMGVNSLTQAEEILQNTCELSGNDLFYTMILKCLNYFA